MKTSEYQLIQERRRYISWRLGLIFGPLGFCLCSYIVFSTLVRLIGSFLMADMEDVREQGDLVWDMAGTGLWCLFVLPFGTFMPYSWREHLLPS